MNKLKSTEKLMVLNQRNANQAYAAAFRKVVRVFRFIDRTEYTNHCDILDELYNVKNKRCTLVGIAAKMGISDNALRRYRRVYVEWFNYFLEPDDSSTAA